MSLKFYYKDDEAGIYLVHGDCLEVLPQLKKEFPTGMDMALVDFPYGINYDSNYRTKEDKLGRPIINDGDLELIKRSAPLIYDNLKDNTAAYFFAHPNMIGENRAIFDQYFTYKNTLVWDKGEGGTAGDLVGGYSLNWEAVLYYNKGRRKLNPPRPRCIHRWDWSARNDSVHPTVKPVSLLVHYIKKSSNEGDMILDCCAGSGTTLAAAKKTGRRAIGIEIDKAYCNRTVERLKQSDLFERSAEQTKVVQGSLLNE